MGLILMQLSETNNEWLFTVIQLYGLYW